MAAKKRTKGVSPKAPAASVAALAAPLVARLLGDALGVDVGSEAAEGIILAAIAGVSALAAAFVAPPGNVVTERSRPSKEAGDMKKLIQEERAYAFVELLVGAILLLVFIWLVFALVD